jgi:choline dehydrogenase-like flavoprotein
MVHENEADVVVVGAGLTGAVFTRELADAGLSVIVLEQGDWPDYSQARADYPDVETTSLPYWQPNPSVRGSAADYPIATDLSEITPNMWNGVGGGTVLYSAKWHRATPSDLRARTMDGVGDDWPIDYAELAPYYDQVERDLAVSGLAGDPAYPPCTPPPNPPMPIREFGRQVAQAHNRLGWHWWPGINAVASRPTGLLSMCRQHGACGKGCPETAKASVDITHWRERSQRVDLRINTVVSRLVIEGGRCAGVECIDPEGSTTVVRGRQVVLAANAVGTARLLLLSGDASGAAAEGVANRSGLVGRRLMLHPNATVAGILADEAGSTAGVWGQQLYSMEFYESDASRGFVRGAKWGLQQGGGPIAVTRAGMYGRGLEKDWGAAFPETLRANLGSAVSWRIQAEDQPDVDNYLELDHDILDPHGLPGVRLHYTADDNAMRCLEWNQERAAESLAEAGATLVKKLPLGPTHSGHAFGTAVMGTDPATSVVNPWGAAHDLPGLTIIDGSIWPTSTAVNPSATLAALALRTARHLLATRRSA